MLLDKAKVEDICRILLSEKVYNIEDIKSLVDSIYDKHFRELLTNHEKSDQTTIDLKKTTNVEYAPSASETDVWIFGYGSLVWKVDFPYIDRRRGYICGFQRRFYQNSIDHRGTPERPGRVVTLLPAEHAHERVYGVAYRIAATHKKNVLDHLDYREKNGYERREVKFYEFFENDNNNTDSSFNIILYIATQANASYAGAKCELPQIAEQIITSCGPSGPNRDYLFHLCTAMKTLFPGVNDAHLYMLEKTVIQRIAAEESHILETELKNEINEILHNYANNAISEKIEMLKKICTCIGWRENVLAKNLQNSKQN